MTYEAMTKEQLGEQIELLSKQYENYKSQGLKLNMTRGVPSPEQLDLSLEMNNILIDREDSFTEGGVDCRTYAADLFKGVPELRRLFAEAFNVPKDYVLIGGNSSLSMIYDTMTRFMLFGTPGGEPWYGKKVKFLCPSPGYDRHFKIIESFGIELITVNMLADGPDMDEVEILIKDPSVRGLICVPKYSNPTGVVFSDEVMRRLAAMDTAAPDFRILMDNAYGVHSIYEDTPLADIFALSREYGHEDRIIYFASTSKITFPGAGVAFMAINNANMNWILPSLQTQSIGPDKINQLRHVKFLKNAENLRNHMRRHAAIIRERFDTVSDTFKEQLSPYGIGDWGDPKGGYFFSLDIMDGCASKVYEMCRDAGVSLTPSGATYPYGKDPRNRNLRIAPTFPTCGELKAAMDVLCVCIKLVTAQKLLESK